MEVFGDSESMHWSASQAGEDEQIERSDRVRAGLLWATHRFLIRVCRHVQTVVNPVRSEFCVSRPFSPRPCGRASSADSGIFNPAGNAIMRSEFQLSLGAIVFELVSHSPMAAAPEYPPWIL